jgi:hypothetical protein
MFMQLNHNISPRVCGELGCRDRAEAQSAATTSSGPSNLPRTSYEPAANHSGHWGLASSKNAVIVPFIVVDPGSAADPVHDDPPDPPPGPDPPPKSATKYGQSRTKGIRGGGKRPMGRTSSLTGVSWPALGRSAATIEGQAPPKSGRDVRGEGPRCGAPRKGRPKGVVVTREKASP